MTDSPAVHIQHEPRTEPFWRGAAVLGLVFVGAVVAVLVGTPALLMWKFRSPWMLLLLVFVAAGVWLLVTTVAGVRKMLWRARHRSSFVLREAGIETTEWNDVGADAPVRRSIPLGTVASVVASYRILRRVILTENGGGTLTETAPILHVLFDQGGRRRITSIPFASHQDPAVDIWIDELRERGVELRYTARLLSWKEEDHLDDEARLAYFATTEETIPFPATGGWLESTTGLQNRWHQQAEQLRAQAEQRDPALREARLKPTALDVILGAWLAGMYALGSSYLLLHLVDSGTLPTAVWPLALAVLLPAAALFFLPLRRGLRWYHLLVCWLLLVVIAFTGVVGSVEIWPAADSTALALFGTAVASPTLLWIPYLLVKRQGLKAL